MASKILNIKDIELIEDFLEFMDLSPDATYENDSVKEHAASFLAGTLVEIEKQITSPIKVLSVKEITDELIKKELGDIGGITENPS